MPTHLPSFSEFSCFLNLVLDFPWVFRIFNLRFVVWCCAASCLLYYVRDSAIASSLSLAVLSGMLNSKFLLCLMFHRFLILCPIRSVSSLTNSCCTEWCRFLITNLSARCCRGWYVWNLTFFSFSMSIIVCDIPVCLFLSLLCRC
jgi:hypothetical protein